MIQYACMLWNVKCILLTAFGAFYVFADSDLKAVRNKWDSSDSDFIADILCRLRHLSISKNMLDYSTLDLKRFSQM